MVDGDMRVVSNYSMICESFCNYDARWMAVGDAAYFVDPLFSSGVTFAVGMAGSACAVARGTLSGQLTERQQRELWSDYTREWRGIAQSFALAIDQWYHAISEQNADSVYWSRRSGHSKSLGIRRATFQALVDTAITPDLLEVLTHGSHELRDLGESGAFLETVSDILKAEPNPEAQLYLGATQIHESFTVDAPGFKASPPPTNPPPELLERIANFWRDPMANNDQLPCPYDGPIPCHRFVRPGSDSGVRFIEERGESGMELFRRLQASPGIRYGKLRETLSPPQQKLLKQLCIAGLVDVKEASALADKPSREGTATLFQ
jgi:hypothetical protein